MTLNSIHALGTFSLTVFFVYFYYFCIYSFILLPQPSSDVIQPLPKRENDCNFNTQCIVTATIRPFVFLYFVVVVSLVPRHNVHQLNITNITTTCNQMCFWNDTCTHSFSSPLQVKWPIIFPPLHYGYDLDHLGPARLSFSLHTMIYAFATAQQNMNEDQPQIEE